ncbi:glycoside hydrolase N-terminal domain-containing protein [Arthrobacter tecti]
MSTRTYWSNSPGEDWEHGIAIGNGLVGALVFGEPGEHQLTLAHERVVLPTDPIRAAPDLAADLPHIRRLIDTGRAQEAAELGVRRSREQGYPALQWTDPLVPVASVHITGSKTSDTENYRRDVDLARGLVTLSWLNEEGRATIRSFMSRSDNITVVEVKGVQGAADGVQLSRPGNVATTQSGVKGGNEDYVIFNEYHLGATQALALSFSTAWETGPAGATSYLTPLERTSDSVLFVVGVFLEVDGTGSDERWITLSETLPTSFDELLVRHEHSFSEQVTVVDLDLDAPTSGDPVEQLQASTDETRHRELLQLQFQSAQALISASTGDLPPTLQGVWSGTFDPAWSSDYTMNGNVQCGSIASMLGTGNHALLRIYLDMLQGFSDDFFENSRLLFGTGGYVMPSRCSPTHGKCTHFDERHCHEFWTAGAAWSAAFFLDYAWYTGDLNFLREYAYPFARETERFYEDFLIRENGRIVFTPSYSPENRSPTFGSQACRNSTMDRAALGGLLNGLQRASELLGLDRDLNERRDEWLRALPPYRVAPDDSLAEWLDEGVEEDLGHRTASQLLGLWFEPDPVLVSDPKLRDAARILIREKLAWRSSRAGKEEMAYGLVQLGIAAAVLGDAESAKECVDRMSRLYFLPSLATTHDVGEIFNVDISGGMPAVIIAMLIGSTMERLTLLPALPKEWATGTIRGVHARGALKIDELKWTAESLDLQVTALPGSTSVRSEQPIEVLLPPGFTLSDQDTAAQTKPGGIITLQLPDGATCNLHASR